MRIMEIPHRLGYILEYSFRSPLAWGFGTWIDQNMLDPLGVRMRLLPIRFLRVQRMQDEIMLIASDMKLKEEPDEETSSGSVGISKPAG